MIALQGGSLSSTAPTKAATTSPPLLPSAPARMISSAGWRRLRQSTTSSSVIIMATMVSMKTAAAYERQRHHPSHRHQASLHRPAPTAMYETSDAREGRGQRQQRTRPAWDDGDDDWRKATFTKQPRQQPQPPPPRQTHSPQKRSAARRAPAQTEEWRKPGRGSARTAHPLSPVPPHTCHLTSFRRGALAGSTFHAALDAPCTLATAAGALLEKALQAAARHAI